MKKKVISLVLAALVSVGFASGMTYSTTDTNVYAATTAAEQMVRTTVFVQDQNKKLVPGVDVKITNRTDRKEVYKDQTGTNSGSIQANLALNKEYGFDVVKLPEDYEMTAESSMTKYFDAKSVGNETYLYLNVKKVENPVVVETRNKTIFVEDQNRKLVPNVQVIIKNRKTGKVVADMMTGTNSGSIMAKLPINAEYEAMIGKLPAGYEMNKQSTSTFWVDNATSEYGTLKITKVEKPVVETAIKQIFVEDQYRKLVPGVQVIVTKRLNGPVVADMVTGTNSGSIVAKLPLNAEYEARVAKLPAGYELTKESVATFYFDKAASGYATLKIRKVEKPVETAIKQIFVEDQYRKLVPGVQVIVTKRLNGPVVADMVTGTNSGSIVAKLPLNAEYEARVAKLPAGYELTKESVATFYFDKAASGYATLKIRKIEKPVVETAIKQIFVEDQDRKLVPGVQVIVTKRLNGPVVADMMTGSNSGSIVVKLPLNAEYEARVAKLPEGYELTKESVATFYFDKAAASGEGAYATLKIKKVAKKDTTKPEVTKPANTKPAVTKPAAKKPAAKNTLPKTGETNSVLPIAFGSLFVLLGAVVLTKSYKKSR